MILATMSARARSMRYLVAMRKTFASVGKVMIVSSGKSAWLARRRAREQRHPG